MSKPKPPQPPPPGTKPPNKRNKVEKGADFYYKQFDSIITDLSSTHETIRDTICKNDSNELKRARPDLKQKYIGYCSILLSNMSQILELIEDVVRTIKNAERSNNLSETFLNLIDIDIQPSILKLYKDVNKQAADLVVDNKLHLPTYPFKDMSAEIELIGDQIDSKLKPYGMVGPSTKK